MEGETTQIPVKKSTRQKLRNISRKGETYNELLNKLIDVREKFEDRRKFSNWLEENFEMLGFDDLEEDPEEELADYMAVREGDEIRIGLEVLSSDFVKRGRSPSQIDLLICLIEDEELSVDTLEIIDFKFEYQSSSMASTVTGYGKILLLLELARGKGRDDGGTYNASPEELADKIGEDLKIVSAWLAELVDENLVMQNDKTGEGNFAITSEGNRLLRSIWLDLEKIFGDFPEKLKLEGELVSGFGEGEYYITKEGYRKQFVDKLGFDPYPGTLDLKLKKESFRAKNWLEVEEGIKIEGFSTEERSFGAAKCFKAKIEDDEAAIVFPYRTHHEDNILEIISPVKIRDKYDLEDGDQLEVEVEI